MCIRHVGVVHYKAEPLYGRYCTDVRATKLLISAHSHQMAVGSVLKCGYYTSVPGMTQTGTLKYARHENAGLEKGK